MKVSKLAWSVPAALLGLGLATAPAPAQASSAATFTLLEVGSNVVGTWSGAFDLTGLGAPLRTGGTGLIITDPTGAVFMAGTGPGDTYFPTLNFDSVLSTGPEATLYNSRSPAASSSDSGGYTGITLYGSGNQGDVVVPLGYTTGTTLSASSTWNSTTLAGLGFTSNGTFVYNYGSNNSSITIQIGPASGTTGGGTTGGGTTGGGGAVPEPGEWAAMGILGAGLTGLVLRKRKKA